MIYSQDDGLVFKIITDDSTAQVIKSRNAKGDIFIPTSIDRDSHKYIVTTISSNAFQNNVKIKSIEFSRNSKLHTIESDAFHGSSLEKITIPASVNQLQGGWCRGTSKLTKIIISPDNNNFKYLDSELKIIIGKDVETKSDNKEEKGELKNDQEFESIIFANRDITEATIPSFIKHIKPYSFYECENLETINFSEDSLLETIEKESFSYSSLETILIPSNVKRLGEGAFSWCLKLETVEFSENSLLISIGKETFSKSSLKRISIPSHLKIIGEGSFCWCKHLHSIQFPNDSELLSIGNCAFYGSTIEVITIPSKVEELKDGWCRYAPQLIRVLVSSGNKRFMCYKDKMVIGKSDMKSDVYDVLYFVYKNISSIVIPSFIKRISSYAFSCCQSLKQVEFENNSNLTSIGKGTFFNSNIETISIPKHLKIIGEETFMRCYRLKKIEFSEDSELQTIGKYAFEDSIIKSISIPSNVNQLQEGWCRGTSKLTNVVVSPQNPNYKYLDSDNKIIIGKSASPENNTDDIFENVIFASRDIVEARIPSYIKCIKPYSFYECQSLKTINFSNDSELEIIDKDSFFYSSLESILIPSNVRIIGESSFFQCFQLNSVEFSSNSNLQRICKEAFAYSSLVRITIPSGVKNIEEDAFSFCKDLKRVEFEDNSVLRQICKKAFAYSCSLKNITIPVHVNKVGEKAFFSCTKLISVEFLNEHVLIEELCFKECTNLFILSFPNARRVTFIGRDFSDNSENFSLFIQSQGIIISTIE